MYVDVHCHLDMDDFDDDRARVIDDARNAGVDTIVVNGTGPESNEAVVELARTYDSIEPALGVYPRDATGLDDEVFDEELSFIVSNDPVAIGEVGLDYTYDQDEDVMRDRFRRQVELATELDVPVIVHSRGAEQDCIDILDDAGCDVIMHCFNGRKHQVQRVIENNWYLSIPPIVLYAEHFQMIASMTPVEQLLTETDAPYLSPYDEVERSEPRFVTESVVAIADVKGKREDVVAHGIRDTYDELFT